MPAFTKEQLSKTKAGAKFLALEETGQRCRDAGPVIETAASIINAPTLPQRQPDVVTVTLPYPPSANRYWRSIVIKGAVRLLVSAEARKYKAKCAGIAAAAFRQPFDGPVGIRLAVFRPIRRGDLGNRIKVLEDVLQGHAYHDDAQIEHIEAKRFDDKLNPRVVVSVWKLTTQTTP